MALEFRRNGPEQQVNTITAGDQIDPSIGRLTGGGYVVTWTDYSNPYNGAPVSVRGQVYSAGGTKVGAEFLVNKVGDKVDQAQSSVAGLTDGSFVVTWMSLDADVGGGILAQRFDASGTRLGSVIHVNQITAQDQKRPAIAAMGDGGYVITWDDGSLAAPDNRGVSVRGQRFDVAGTMIGGEFLVNTDITSNEQYVQIASAGAGFVAVWEHANKIYGQFFDGAAAKLGPEFTWTNSTTATYRPAVTALDNGSVVVAWFTQADTISARIVNASGVVTSTELDVGRQSGIVAPAVAAVGGGFVVTWSADGGGLGDQNSTIFGIRDGSGAGIAGQLYTNAGVRAGNPFIVNTTVDGAQSNPVITTTTDGALAIVWQDASGDGSGSGLRSQVLAPYTAPGSVTLSNAAVSETAVENLPVSRLSAAGPLNGSLTYTIVSDDSGAFGIVGNQLVVADNNRLNYEAMTQANLQIRATDAQGQSQVTALTVTITDVVNEARYGAGPDRSPGADVARLTNGNTVAVYAVQSEVFVQLGDASGVAIGSPIKIATKGANDFYTAPEVVAQGTGFTVLYEHTRSDFVNGIYHVDARTQRFDAAGTPVGSVAVVSHTGAISINTKYEFAALAGDGYAATWISNSTIYAKRYDSSGQAIGAAITVATPASSNVTPHIDMLVGGGLVVSWNIAAGAETGAVHAQAYDANGVKVGSEIVTPPSADAAALARPVTTLADGGFLVSSSSGGARFVQEYSASGVAIGGAVALPVTGPLVQLATGEFVALDTAGLIDKVVLLSRSFVSIGTLQDIAAGDFANLAAATIERLGDGFVVTYTIGSDTTLHFRVVAPANDDQFVPITGTAGDDTLTGTPGNDVILGLGGNDILNGLGGAARTDGGFGDDYHFVDNALDVVIERAGEGDDRVFAAVSYVLPAAVAVERLTTADNDLTAAINLTGNAFAQSIFGNAGANIIDGGGGEDSHDGFGGNDWYFVDSPGDIVYEFAGGGTDRVFARVTYRLPAAAEVEVLVTYDESKFDAIDLYGNGFANFVVGNAAGNTIDGGGGADDMAGLGGNDFYYVDDAGDRVYESVGGGDDRVFASVSFALRGDAEVEKLTTADNAGTSAIALTGNDFAQAIFGNDGANLIDGKGGSDTLVGLGGADTFAFTSALGAGNVDLIYGFVSGSDNVALDRAIFTALAPGGALPAAAFVNGAAALDADDRILFDAVTGRLFYDADGNGAGAAVLFATLVGGATITAADFAVI